jgi:hypothetical protein
MKPRRHAQIHLPPLSADYALTLVGIFERAIEAIWRAHGDGMAEIRALRADASPPRNPDYVECGNPHAPDDTDF